MVAGSILPVAIHKNKLYFLFGKENPLESSSKGWSDFGGGVDKGETPYETAMREGGEELTGFLGDALRVRKLVRKYGNTYKLVHNDYHVHLFLMDYDANLPIYYNNNHEFLWKRMDPHVLNKTKLFEKIEIEWFSVDETRHRRNEFREFYREIVDKLIAEHRKIHNFMKQRRRSQRHTQRTHPIRRRTMRVRRMQSQTQTKSNA